MINKGDVEVRYLSQNDPNLDSLLDLLNSIVTEITNPFLTSLTNISFYTHQMAESMKRVQFFSAPSTYGYRELGLKSYQRI